MNNQENSIIISMLQNMQQDITEMRQSIVQTNKRIDSLEEKFENRFNALEKTFDEKLATFERTFDDKLVSVEKTFDKKLDALEKKVDNNSANIIKILNTISIMQKDITYLRDDVETVYSLEKDSRKHLKLS